MIWLFLIIFKKFNSLKFTKNHHQDPKINIKFPNFSRRTPIAPRPAYTPSAPPVSPPEPASNLTDQFDCPPSYEEAMVHISHPQQQQNHLNK